MGFFHKRIEHAFIEIAKSITNGDDTIITEVRQCISHPQEYFDEHIEDFEERGIDNYEDEDPEMIQWLALVDILKKYRFACECDWKEDKEEYVNKIRSLYGTKKNDLDMKDEWLKEKDNVPEWCAVLDKKWSIQECCIASFDIDSDSYVMFICPVKELNSLSKFANEYDYRIDRSCNM